MIEEKIAPANHPIMAEIKNRWSPRAFAEKPVEKEKLLRIFEAARWAPSSSNGQGWRWIIAQKGDAHYDKLFEGMVEGNQGWAKTAPVLGCTFARKTFEGKDRDYKHSWHDLGLAMGNFLAQATHEGLHVHQMAGIKPETIIENFDVDTKNFDVVAMFTVGYQDEDRLSEIPEKHHESEKKPRERKPLEELVFGEKFGETSKIIGQ